MTIRGLAEEVYRAIREVERLERELAELPPDSPRREEVREELRVARADRDRIKKMLNGAKAGD